MNRNKLLKGLQRLAAPETAPFDEMETRSALHAWLTELKLPFEVDAFGNTLVRVRHGHPRRQAVRRDAELWAGCLAGSLEEDDYRSRLRRVGFIDVEIEPTRIYAQRDRSRSEVIGDDRIAGLFMSAFIRAKKPMR